MLRYKTKTRPGLVALYDIQPRNGAGPFLQPRSPHRAWEWKKNIPRFQGSVTTLVITEWLSVTIVNNQ